MVLPVSLLDVLELFQSSELIVKGTRRHVKLVSELRRLRAIEILREYRIHRGGE